MIEHILKGGIHPNGNKISDISSIKDFQVIEGDEFFIPFVQHIGSPASAVVKIGDEVERGDFLAYICANDEEKLREAESKILEIIKM